MSKIGIFWIWQETIFGAAQEPANGIENYPGIIDSQLDHASTWDKMQHCNCLPEELTDREYYTVPRGRVLLRKGGETLVYLDKKLINRFAKLLITDFFEASLHRIQWCSDSHYTTTETEIELLFQK